MRDLEASLAFFQDGLGLPLKLRTAAHAELQTETVVLELVQRDGAAGPARSSPSLAWEVEDLDSAVRGLEARGVVFEADRSAPGCPPTAGHRRRFRDPDGHAFELVAYPSRS